MKSRNNDYKQDEVTSMVRDLDEEKYPTSEAGDSESEQKAEKEYKNKIRKLVENTYSDEEITSFSKKIMPLLSILDGKSLDYDHTFSNENHDIVSKNDIENSAKKIIPTIETLIKDILSNDELISFAFDCMYGKNGETFHAGKLEGKVIYKLSDFDKIFINDFYDPNKRPKWNTDFNADGPVFRRAGDINGTLTKKSLIASIISLSLKGEIILSATQSTLHEKDTLFQAWEFINRAIAIYLGKQFAIIPSKAHSTNGIFLAAFQDTFDKMEYVEKIAQLYQQNAEAGGGIQATDIARVKRSLYDLSISKLNNLSKDKPSELFKKINLIEDLSANFKLKKVRIFFDETANQKDEQLAYDKMELKQALYNLPSYKLKEIKDNVTSPKNLNKVLNRIVNWNNLNQECTKLLDTYRSRRGFFKMSPDEQKIKLLDLLQKVTTQQYDPVKFADQDMNEKKYLLEQFKKFAAEKFGCNNPLSILMKKRGLGKYFSSKDSAAGSMLKEFFGPDLIEATLKSENGEQDRLQKNQINHQKPTQRTEKKDDNNLEKFIFNTDNNASVTENWNKVVKAGSMSITKREPNPTYRRGYKERDIVIQPSDIGIQSQDQADSKEQPKESSDKLREFIKNNILNGIKDESTKEQALEYLINTTTHQGGLLNICASACQLPDFTESIKNSRFLGGPDDYRQHTTFEPIENGFVLKSELTIINLLSSNIKDKITPDKNNKYILDTEVILKFQFDKNYTFDQQNPSHPDVTVENSYCNFGNEDIKKLLSKPAGISNFITPLVGIKPQEPTEELNHKQSPTSLRR